LIEKNNIDMLVLGTQGRRLAAETSAWFVRGRGIPAGAHPSADRPATREPLYEIEFRNILFATDFGPTADKQAASLFPWLSTIGPGSPSCM
jgi:hypothetical protein